MDIQSSGKLRKNKIRIKIGFRIINTTQMSEITRKKNFCHNLTQPALRETTKKKDQNLSKVALILAILLIKFHHIAALSAHSSGAPASAVHNRNDSIRQHKLKNHHFLKFSLTFSNRVLHAEYIIVNLGPLLEEIV
uniref:Uncharacterized protein n=1 Tax=Glossina palpalis gambiensis TaxID=67801 RepID=A0A1B0BXD3_9MUSC